MSETENTTRQEQMLDDAKEAIDFVADVGKKFDAIVEAINKAMPDENDPDKATYLSLAKGLVQQSVNCAQRSLWLYEAYCDAERKKLEKLDS